MLLFKFSLLKWSRCFYSVKSVVPFEPKSAQLKKRTGCDGAANCVCKESEQNLGVAFFF